MVIRFVVAALVATVGVGPAVAQAPAGVDVIPSTAFGFATVKVSDLWDGKAFQPVKDVLTQGEKPLAAEVAAVVGVGPAELERITLFWPSLPFGPDVMAPYMIVTTRKPYNEAKVLQVLRAQPFRPGLAFPGGLQPPPAFPPKAASGERPSAEKKAVDIPDKCGELPTPDADGAAGPELYVLQSHGFAALFLLDDRNLLLFPQSINAGIDSTILVGQLLRKKADGPLAMALQLAGKHTVAAGIQVGPIEGLIQGIGQFPRDLVPFRSLLKAKSLVVTADTTEVLTATVRLAFADDASARRAEPVLKTLFQTVSDLLTDGRTKAAADDDLAGIMLPLIDALKKGFDTAEVAMAGATVDAKLSGEIGPALAKAMTGAPAMIRAASDRTRSMNNLKQIGLAIHNYHDAYGKFPHDTVDANGKPILSWRAHILPFIEQDQLYRQMDMTKSWDDPVNKRFVEQMPSVFGVYGRETDGKGLTYLQMPSSPPRKDSAGDPFQVYGTKRGFNFVTDGLSNTFMVVEAADAVNWLKPGDVQFDPKALPKLGSVTRGKFLALFGDGSVRDFKRAKLTDETLRALFTTNGGEVFTLPD